jgi:hypothetical protein
MLGLVTQAVLAKLGTGLETAETTATLRDSLD